MFSYFLDLRWWHLLRVYLWPCGAIAIIVLWSMIYVLYDDSPMLIVLFHTEPVRYDAWARVSHIGYYRTEGWGQKVECCPLLIKQSIIAFHCLSWTLPAWRDLWFFCTKKRSLLIRSKNRSSLLCILCISFSICLWHRTYVSYLDVGVFLYQLVFAVVS